MRPGAVTHAGGTHRALRVRPFTRNAASALFVGLFFFAALSLYVSPFVLHDDTGASSHFAVLGEDDPSGRSGGHGQPGADELGDGVDLLPHTFGAWRETSRFERLLAPEWFEFRGDPLTPQSLERPPPGR
jgi:hypothetical protein